MQPVSFLPCRHRGDEVGPGLRRCHSPRLTGTKQVTPALCQGCYCRDHPLTPGQPDLALPGFEPRPGDPPCGVVIGSYRWPRLVELQIHLIRHTCGPVPILIGDDCSPGFGPPLQPGSRFDRLQAVCAGHPGVTLWPNVERIGHTGGDVSACWKGLIWAKALGLRVLAKLSQRFLVVAPRWLQDGARDLLESELPLAGQRCRGREVFDLRTEAMLFDVAAWSRPAILQRLLPRRHGHGRFAETVINEALGELGGIFWPWRIITEERYQATPGVVWHTANAPTDYRDLAARFGLGLDDDFTTDGWQNDPSYLYG